MSAPLPTPPKLPEPNTTAEALALLEEVDALLNACFEGKLKPGSEAVRELRARIAKLLDGGTA